jgi:hypothetical protein
MKRRLCLSRASLAAVVLVVAALSPARGQRNGSAAPPRDIRAGDPLRAILLDALRPTIEQDLGQPVQFVVTTLRVQGEWAFAVVTPQTRSGGKIDYMKTRHAERLREGAFDGGYVEALLRNEGGQWIVKDFAVGPTDVYHAGWPDRFGAPYQLLGLPKPD